MTRRTADMAGDVPITMHITDSPIPLPDLLAHMKPVFSALAALGYDLVARIGR
jgi:hypothetical protein